MDMDEIESNLEMLWCDSGCDDVAIIVADHPSLPRMLEEYAGERRGMAVCPRVMAEPLLRRLGEAEGADVQAMIERLNAAESGHVIIYMMQGGGYLIGNGIDTKSLAGKIYDLAVLYDCTVAFRVLDE